MSRSRASIPKDDCEGYRLPTEAEWEYACRSGSPTELYSGEIWGGDLCGAAEIDDLAWYSSNSDHPPYQPRWHCWVCSPYEPLCGPREVARKQPSPWGLYDMLGNMDEWVFDWGVSYPDEPVVDPIAQEPPGTNQRIARGGGWGEAALDTRCTVRRWFPLKALVGAFRLVRTVR